MLALGSCLGILHKNPHLLSHLVSRHRCKRWHCSDLEHFRLIAFILSIIWHSKFLSNTFAFFIQSAGICSRGKSFLASLQTSTWLFVFPKEPTRVTCQTPLTVILYDPRTASANKNSSTRAILSNISRAPVGMPGKADEIIRKASLCSFVSFLTRYFLLRPPAQDTHAHMIGRIQ